jgi:trehalose 6-phosphate synthase/phosphatase
MISPTSHDTLLSKSEEVIHQIREKSKIGVTRLSKNDTVTMICFQLPLSVERDQESGAWIIQPSKYTTMPLLYKLLAGDHAGEYLPAKVRFVGWAGISVQEDERDSLRGILYQHNCVPVFPPSIEVWQDYVAFCQGFLKPLCHSLFVPLSFEDRQWKAYLTMNEVYAETATSFSVDHFKIDVDPLVTPGKPKHLHDLIWVHDYHLMMCPMYLTIQYAKVKNLSSANVGLFLHTPFASSEIYRCIPVRDELLRGMLCADMIQFQLFAYARHFLSCCKRYLDLDHAFKSGGMISVGPHIGRNINIRSTYQSTLHSSLGLLMCVFNTSI